jgi:hypothetical protein
VINEQAFDSIELMETIQASFTNLNWRTLILRLRTLVEVRQRNDNQWPDSSFGYYCGWFWSSWYYDWKEDKGIKYYHCKDGTLKSLGIYDSSEHAAEYFDKCEKTFGEKFEEAKSNPKYLKEIFWPYK